MRIIDCFPYNGDVIALFRLEYLWDVVDEFIIVEARHTHTGEKKAALFLDEYAAQFEPFRQKITKLIIDQFPEPTAVELALIENPKHKTDPRAWYREKYQRNFASTYLRQNGGAAPWIVLACDADEIPRREIIKVLRENYNALSESCRLEMAFFYYSSAWIKRDKWYHAFAVNDQGAQRWLLDDIRINTAATKFIRDAGWHFSYFMSEHDIQRKIKSFAHTEFNSEAIKNLEWITHCKTTGFDLYRRGPTEDCLGYQGDDLPENLRAFERQHGIRV